MFVDCWWLVGSDCLVSVFCCGVNWCCVLHAAFRGLSLISCGMGLLNSVVMVYSLWLVFSGLFVVDCAIYLLSRLSADSGFGWCYCGWGVALL